MQFTLRIRDDIRKALNSSDPLEKIQASSTYIHENIHWWQHIGSNFGYIFSLAYPAFTHISNENLKNAISQGIACKSIKKFDEEYYKNNSKSDLKDINIILNNYHDLEYAKSFALDNNNIKYILKDKRFFLNIGHCYHILWSSTVHTLADTLDRYYTFLPNTNHWVKHFRELEKSRAVGFFIDSPVQISPLGIKAIYEGQAIFNQMQYLTKVLNRNLTYTDFINAGLLYGIYLTAFDLFLNITKLQKPISLLDSQVGLFLIICDISINPNNGFPLEIYDYENFISKNDPGIRFTNLCLAISKKSNYYVNKLNSYSKDEYILLSKELSDSIGCKCPYEGIKNVLDWSIKKEVKQVLKEESDSKYSFENLPIRLMFSKYFRFQEDKIKYPHIFCWFGYHSLSENTNIEFNIMNSLYKKHHALFIDDYDNEIKPVLFEGKPQKNIVDSFNAFYNFNLFYDLVLQWVSKEGEFNFDYKWLANNRSDSFIPFIKEQFKMQYNISLDDIKVV